MPVPHRSDYCDLTKYTNLSWQLHCVDAHRPCHATVQEFFIGYNFLSCGIHVHVRGLCLPYHYTGIIIYEIVAYRLQKRRGCVTPMFPYTYMYVDNKIQTSIRTVLFLVTLAALVP